MRRDLNDAYALLGLEPGADAAEIAAAYRARAKEEHPDHSEEQHAADRMAAVNAAHDVLTAALLTGLTGEDAAGPGAGWTAAAAAPSAAGADRSDPPVAPHAPARAGAWLTADLRRALGPELVEELADGEPVDLVAHAATWASPHTTVAVTDRRVLWLLDDAVSGRVRSLRLRLLDDVRSGARGIVRPSGFLTLRPRQGRKVTFTELPVETAQALAGRIEARRAEAGG